MLSGPQVSIVRFCAEECNRQNSGELSVADMVEAYQLASVFEVTDGKRVSHSLIISLGKKVHDKNSIKSYRKTNVQIGSQILTWEIVEYQMENLITYQDDMSPEEFYQEFESIHPFVDGNGRVGAILYNYKRGTLSDPKIPPPFENEQTTFTEVGGESVIDDLYSQSKQKAFDMLDEIFPEWKEAAGRFYERIVEKGANHLVDQIFKKEE